MKILHDIRKNSYAMESGKETFHDIRKNSYIMEPAFNPPIQLHHYPVQLIRLLAVS